MFFYKKLKKIFFHNQIKSIMFLILILYLFFNYQFKIMSIELLYENVNSINFFIPINQTVEQQHFCKLPNLSLKRHFLRKKYTPCKLNEEWGYLQGGKWFFNKSVVDKYSKN